MRGGLERWKRGVASEGVHQAVAYAFEGKCDATRGHQHVGVEQAVGYGAAPAGSVGRFTVTRFGIDEDRLGAAALARWVDGADPDSGDYRGRELTSPDADLLFDATMNMPKSYSLAVLLTPVLRAEFEALQDRIRDRTLQLWQRELNARRGAGGLIREPISRLEVVELRHERSRALDPHIHRHLWLNVKVLGDDGKWSNVDSRVAMKLHTVVNAEGDLASRTDPDWVAALAQRGYSLSEEGEVAELAHLVRPLSRRSNQIEANRALKLAEWRQTHPGQQPDHATLAWIDRWAWAQSRPGKPDVVDEDAWQELIRAEITSLDSYAATPRVPAAVRAMPVGGLDRDLLAAVAVADADRRSAGSGGRFSRFDVRAGAIRALAASGVIAAREVLDEVIEDVTGRALDAHVVDFLDGESDAPAHVKHLMSLPTAQDKLDLAAHLDQLNEPGLAVPTAAIAELAATVLEGGVTLDAGQTQAASAIAGTSRLVTVTGPAGTGKTTLLQVARQALHGQLRRMVVVAPTRKAATVAGREIGAAASSLHALLVDHGYRFGDDATGRTVWTRLRPGDSDLTTGVVHLGPRRFLLRRGDRVVVDEAGMVDLQTANALAQLAADTGAGIAMIGDHLQAMPVGHSGAMATMQRRSGHVVELTAVHRFRDPDYAALTLRLRDPADHAEATAVARELVDRGHVGVVATEHEARERMVGAWLHHAARGERIALVTATNAEAQQINERIQQERLDRGQLTADRFGLGQHGQYLLVGDVVQTRRNDTDSGVDNRATWTVAGIRAGRIELVSISDSGDRRTISDDYAAEHVHLAYASTVHGIQGETVHASYVGPGVDAAGLYVGMTRGRHADTVLTTARDSDQAVERLADTMMRGQLELTLDDARRAAQRELGRAARRPEEKTGESDARWNDRNRRPYGALNNVAAEISRMGTVLEEARHDLGGRRQVVRDDRATLRQLDATIANRAATSHARASAISDPESDDRARRETLAVAVDAGARALQQATEEYRRAAASMSALADEQRRREHLSTDMRAAEDRERGIATEVMPVPAERSRSGVSR
jgi:exodeoxyribonuclease V alpha subunit